MPELDPIPARLRSGDEPFLAASAAPFTLRDFWRWSSSDLMSNTTRGVLAEFLVGRAVGALRELRVEWDEYDLELRDGTRIEVKSSAYLQSWKQSRLSAIRFGIAPTRGEAGAERVLSRHSDVFVFCLLESKDQATVDPLDLEQWRFLVLATRVLDAEVPLQKNIGLAALRRLGPLEVRFGQLAEAVRNVLEPPPSATNES